MSNYKLDHKNSKYVSVCVCVFSWREKEIREGKMGI